MYTHLGMCVGVIELFVRVDSLLPSSKSQGLNSGHQVFQLVLLPAEPSHDHLVI